MKVRRLMLSTSKIYGSVLACRGDAAKWALRGCHAAIAAYGRRLHDGFSQRSRSRIRTCRPVDDI